MTDLAVQIEGLSKSFDGRLVLDGVDLEVPCGSIVSIIGSSGGGKTTLMRCVNLLERPDRAQMEVAGEPIFEGERMVCRDLARLRQTVGMVFQRFNLFPHLTAVENVMLAQIKARGVGEREAIERAVKLLRRVGLGAPRARLPRADVGRRAAARGDRPRPGAAADRAAVRRADVLARPGVDRRGAEGHARAGRGRDDDAPGHARAALRARRLGLGRVHRPRAAWSSRARPRRCSAPRARSARGRTCGG